jgi:hypothetical protein
MHRLFFYTIAGSILLFATASVASAATFYTSPSGSDSNSCNAAQNTANPKRTINNALGCMGAGDTLYMRDGTYNETLHSGSVTFPTGTNWSNAPKIASFPGETAIISSPPGVGDVIAIADSYVQYLIFEDFIVNGGHNGIESREILGETVKVR